MCHTGERVPLPSLLRRMSSSSFVSNGGGTPVSSGSATRDANNNCPNGADNLLKLALKKPKSWKWELTTSSSSPGISFPKIQLFDSVTGALMVQVDKADCVVKSEEVVNGSDRSRSSHGRDQRYRRSRSSCIREKVVTSGEYLSDVFEQLQSKGMGYKLATSASQFRMQEDEEMGDGCPIQKSKSANEVRKSAPVEQNGPKKKVLKSTTSRSSSILGRISEFYKSSTEDEPMVIPPPPPPSPPPTIPEIRVVEEPVPEHKQKIYKLVRSNAGTLMVREESFHTQNSLRRRKELEDALLNSVDLSQQDQRVSQPDQRTIFQDIPESSYDSTINEIDNLISKVMLSHTLQDVKEPHHGSRGRTVQNGSGNGNGSVPVRKRRSRRSASAGSNASGSRRGRNSPLVTAPIGSSSEEEDPVSLAESRFGSLKRRGRPKYKRNDTAAGGSLVNGGLANGQAAKRLETNVRTSSVRIEECGSQSLRWSNGGSYQNASKSSSASSTLSTLSPPSPPTVSEYKASDKQFGEVQVPQLSTTVSEVKGLNEIRCQTIAASSAGLESEKQVELTQLVLPLHDGSIENDIVDKGSSPSSPPTISEFKTPEKQITVAQVPQFSTVVSEIMSLNETGCQTVAVSSAELESEEPVKMAQLIQPSVCDASTKQKSLNGCEPKLKSNIQQATVTNISNLISEERQKKTTLSIPEESPEECTEVHEESNQVSVESPASKVQPQQTTSPTPKPLKDSLKSRILFRQLQHFNRSPRISPNSSNGVPPDSEPSSILPHLATSHSTSSLAFLRTRTAFDNSQPDVQQQQQQQLADAGKRRQPKPYARRHHRSSYLAFP